MAAKSLSSWWPFPPQVKYIVGNECCERFSFYGMRSILTIFMVQVLLFEDASATHVMHLFIAGCYLTPLLGAYLADRFFGKYHVILYLSLFYCLGHGVLAIWENTTGLYIGLALIAFGAGGIKPCVSAYVGDQFTKKNSHLLKAIYDIFYFSINLGSVASSALTPYLLKHHGASVAFGVPGILMAIATLIFWMGRKSYTNTPPSGYDKHSVMKVIMSGFSGGKGFWKNAEAQHPKDRVEGAQAVVSLLKMFSFIAVFWALFDQTTSTWVIQGKAMVQNFTLFGMDMEILPSQMQAVNPFLVMLMIPLFSLGVYPFISKFYEMTPLRRMGWGIGLAGISYFQVAFIQTLIEQGAQVNILWQSVPYFTITAAEIMVSITGLEFGYTQSPKSVKSTIMSIWFLGVFLGNFLVVFLTEAASLLKIEVVSTEAFMMYGVLSILTAGLFGLYVKNYKMRNYVN